METIRTPLVPSPDLEAHLGYLLRRVSSHVSGSFARALKAKHTSVAEWVVLCRVHERPGITPGELAEFLNLTRGAVSKIVDKLEAKHWVVPTVSTEDSRVQSLSLTRSGGRNLPHLAEIADQNDRAFFDVLSAKDKANLRRILGKMSELHQIRSVPVE